MKKENNKMNCHSRVFLSGISTLFPRPLRQRMSVDRMRGFTLMEILVVVVIIAVLATIAVSAYQKAVVKSRFSGLMPLAKTLAQGNEDYYLRNGQYTDDVDKLDIRATGNSKTQITLSDEDQHKYVLLTRDDMNNNLRMYQQKSPNFPGETHCEALIDDTLANWLCRDALKGTLVGNKYGYTVYSLSEDTVGTLARQYVNQNGVTLDAQESCSATNDDVCNNVVSDGGKCIGATYASCRFGNYSNHSKCEGTGYATCNKSTYTLESSCLGNSYWDPCTSSGYKNKSYCVGESRIACNSSLFQDQSYCEGKVNSCQNSTFENRSYCEGKNKDACTASRFRDNSICYARKAGACAGSDYDNTSYCDGSFCPEGARSSTAGQVWHREEGWDDETESVLIDAPTTTE